MQCGPSVICDEYATDHALANGARITHRFRWQFAPPAPGREQPSGPASGRQRVQNRGVAHAPALSATPAKCVSCAAQNAALVVLPLSLQVVGVERLPGERSRTLINRPPVSTNNLALPNCANHRSLSRPPSRRQPFHSWNLKTRVAGAPRTAPVCLRKAKRI